MPDRHSPSSGARACACSPGRHAAISISTPASAVNALGHADPHLVETTEGGGRQGLAHLQRLHDSRAGAAGPAAGRRDTSPTAVFFTNSGAEARRVRHQDGAALLLRQGRAGPLRDHRLHRLVPRPHAWPPSPRPATRTTPRASVRPLPGFKHLEPGDLDAVEAADRRQDLRHPDRAGAGRRRGHRHAAPSSCAACGSSATSTACC